MAQTDGAPAGPVRRVRESLAPYPARLRLLDACLDCLRGLEGAAAALAGSAGRGAVDAFSDLDLRVCPPPGMAAAELRDRVLAALQGIARPLAVYTGGHLGLTQLLILVLEVDGGVEKLDLYVLGPGEDAAGGVVLWDPRGRFAAAAPADAPADGGGAAEAEAEGWRELHHRFCGWLWFSYVRIARGEPLAAAASLDFTREHALDPLLRRAVPAPGGGFPPLDRLLPPELRRMLANTYAARLDGDGLLAALAAAADLWETAWARAGLPPAPAGLERMVELIPGLAARRAPRP